MASISTPKEDPDDAWMPCQPPGEIGIDSDWYGIEMAPNARVWKKYVEETDRMDKELVEGWNKTLDVILIFAALFSAISTAFVIESSKDLKPDHSETSARTLEIMSQTLSAIARGSSLNDSDTVVPGTQEFTPSSSAVAVNALWFLSLGLSVAVSLIAILAKEWCHSFMAGRIGSMLRQARLRQQRWDGIERWKMKEILYVLPLLMHTALLLFAIGLSLYLWNINIRVALPVVITTSLAGLFYVVTVSLPLFFRYCPYTTALSRFIYPYWLAAVGNRRTMDLFGALVASLVWISELWVRLRQDIKRRFHLAGHESGDADLEAIKCPQFDGPPPTFRNKMQLVHGPIREWIESMRAVFSTDRSQLEEIKTPMDVTTSSIIAWMIANCEDSKSVDLALEALAGAEPSLPRLPLWECGAVELVFRRLHPWTVGLDRPTIDNAQPVSSAYLHKSSLYSRSFSFLVAFVAGEGLSIQDWSTPRFIVKGNRELADRIASSEWAFNYWVRGGGVNKVLDCAWSRPTPLYEFVALELNNIPLEASVEVWTKIESDRKQCLKQRELVKRIISGKTDLPLMAILALINGITKTCFYDTLESPRLLLELFDFLERDDRSIEYRHGIAVGLTIAALATGSYLTEANCAVDGQNNDAFMKQAKKAYDELTPRTMTYAQEETLICFGLLCLLNHKTGDKWSLSIANVKLIERHLSSDIWIINPYHSILPGIPASFDRGQHVARVFSNLLHSLSLVEGQDHDPGSALPILSRLEAVTNPSTLASASGHLVPLLVPNFTLDNSTQMKIICLRGMSCSLQGQSLVEEPVLQTFLQSALLKRILEATQSIMGDVTIIPYCMEFLWMASLALLISSDDWIPEARRSAAQSLLRSLDNPFTISTKGGHPSNRGEMGLADLWLPNIDAVCRSHPQVVLDSHLLPAMAKFYEYEGHTSFKPRTSELPGSFDNTWTWLQILRYFEQSCKLVVEQQINSKALLSKELEAGFAVCGGREDNVYNEACADMHDWSI